MNYIDWNTIGLLQNPFLISSPEDPSVVKWAGMKTIKNELISVLKEAKGSGPTQVVLCRGAIGGGKTHAALYFNLSNRWPEQQPCVRKVYTLYVQTPKETGKPDRSFYINTLETLDLESIKQTVREVIEEVGIIVAKRILRRTMVSADLTNALLGLGEEEPHPLLDAYFLGKCTTSELRKLRLNRNIGSSQDYFRVLAGVFQCYIGLSPKQDVRYHSRVCLWLDELEDFLYFTPSQYRPFGQGLRELVDRVPNFFTLFLNFTLTSPEEYEEIALILGEYLIDRVTHNIFFDEMREEEKLIYVRELLKLYASENRAELVNVEVNPFYPFKEDALKFLLSDLPRRTPRVVNKRCRLAIIRAFEKNLFAGRSNFIDREFVIELDREELDREIG